MNAWQRDTTTRRLSARKGYLAAGVVVGLGLLVSLTVFGWDYHSQRYRLREQLQREAEERAVAIERGFAASELVLDALRRFYAGSQEVEPDEFHTFVGPYFGKVPGLELLGWVPWTGAEGQPAEGPAPGGPPQTEPGSSAVSAASGQASAHDRVPPLCIRLAEPWARAGQLLGFDLGSLPEVRRCLLRAADSGQAAATGKIALPGDEPGGGDLLLAAPVYVGAEVPEDPAARRGRMRGLVVALVELRPLLRDSLQHMASDQEIDVWLVDDQAASGSKLLAAWPPESGPSDQTSFSIDDRSSAFSRRMLTADRRFRVWCRPHNEWFGLQATWRSWVVLALGLALTSALGIYLLSWARQDARLGAAYRELEQAHEDLVREVQQRTEAERRLADLNQRHEAILAAVPEMICQVDREKRYTWANQAAIDFFGPDLIGREAADYFVDAQDTYEKVQPLFQGSEQVIYVESWQRRRDGQARLLAWWCRTLKDQQGRVLGALSTARDITERKRAEEQFQELAEQLQLRVKQIDCLHGITRVLEDREVPMEHLVRKTAGLLPRAFRQPESACARVMLLGHVAETPDFQETPWRLASPILVDGQHAGALDVCYRELLPGRDDVPFLNEEKALVEEVADRLGTVLSRVRAEQRVRELKQQIEFILGATRTGLAVIDADLHLQYVDPEWERIYGDPEGKTCCQYFCAQDEPCDQCGVVRARDDRCTVILERALPKEGDRPVQVTSIPFQDSDGCWCVAQVNADISERKKAEAALRASEARHRTITQSAEDAIITADMQGVILFWNPAAERIFGFTAEEAVGRNMMELIVPPEFHEAKRRGMALLARTGQGAALNKTLELRGLRKDGTRFPIDISVSAYRGEDGFVGVALVRDISQRKKLEARLQHGRKLEAIGQLAAGIAHEINTPIQYVGDNMRFVAEAFENIQAVFETLGELLTAAGADKLDPLLWDRLQAAVAQADVEYLADEIPRAMQQGLEGVGRVAEIVRAMKELAHPGGEQKQAVDLNRAVHNTITISRNEWKYVAEVETRFDPQLPAVPCLPGELNQVLLNLIVNAAHAIAEKNKDHAETKGTITVSTRRDGRWVEIAVADTGTGIPEEIGSQVFNPFFTTKEPGRGTGQGLAIAHNIIVEKHHGHIDFESRPGEGTKFTVRLPLDDESTECLSPEQPAEAVSAADGVASECPQPAEAP